MGVVVGRGVVAVVGVGGGGGAENESLELCELV